MLVGCTTGTGVVVLPSLTAHSAGTGGAVCRHWRRSVPALMAHCTGTGGAVSRHWRRSAPALLARCPANNFPSMNFRKWFSQASLLLTTRDQWPKRSHSSNICFARNLDSTCANHPAGLSAQNGGSVMLTLLAITCGCVAACSWSRGYH